MAPRFGPVAGTLHLLTALNLVQIQYPSVRRDLGVVDDYFGTKVADPYRWLEDLNSRETSEFVRAQQSLTEKFLSHVPARDEIRRHVERVWNFPRRSVPQRVGDKYFSMENPGLQNHSVLFVRDSLYGHPRLYFDPADLSVDGAVAFETFAFSGDGRYFAYLLQIKGSDWKVIKFRDMWTGRELGDILKDTKTTGIVWASDGTGVFYSRYTRKSRSLAESSQYEKLYFHKLGTPQSQDFLVAEFPKNPAMRISAQVSQDLNYLIIRGMESFNASAIYVAPMWHGIDRYLRLRVVPVFPSPTENLYEYVGSSVQYIGNEGSLFQFRTSLDASNYKVIKVRINVQKGLRTSPAVDYMWTIVPEDKTRVLDMAVPLNSDLMLLRYIENAEHKLVIRSIKARRTLYRLNFAPGSMTDYSVGYIDGNTLEFFVQMESFVNPGTTYRCLLSGLYVECDIFDQQKTIVDVSRFESKLVSFPSKDGTIVSMHIVKKRGLMQDGSAPAMLYGYGGFNVPMLPRFSISNLIFMENFNGIYAQAVIRGGGEFGAKWYSDGVLTKKQNSFDDFQAAAEYLISQKYTSASKLTIKGGSHGGLLVAACVNQRPDLFGAAIAQSGVMDLLRYQHFTGGQIWCQEYGCSDNKAAFSTLMKYSPLHNIKPPAADEVQYPGVLVMVADHDDRVVPSHSYKYIAQLQHTIGTRSSQKNPLLLRITKDVGHSSGHTMHKLIEDITDMLSFVADVLGLEFKPTASSRVPTNSNKRLLLPNYFQFPSLF